MSIQKEYVRSMKLAALLMLQGFRILEVQKDKKNTDYDVYVFKHTPELTHAIFKYINGKNGENYGTDNENCKCKSSSIFKTI